MDRFRSVVVEHAEKFHSILNMVEGCQSSDELILKIRGDLIKKSRPHKPKTTIKIRVEDTYFYLKTRWEIGIKHSLRDLFRGCRPGCREAKNYLTLQKLGFNIPTLIAYGCTRYFNSKNNSYQVIKELKGAFTLRQYLENNKNEEVIKQVGNLIWLLHRKNFVYGDFNCDNILVSKKGNTSELYLIDPIGLKRSNNNGKKFSDLVKFIFKNGIIWLDEENIDRFLRNYYSFFSKSDSRILNYKTFRTIIDRKIHEKMKL
jgi:tRNA A-37 threonylcarbamoyl transferase component Bud32